METDFGLVSIIMPAYNSSKYIAKTIDSIVNQSYTNWELLITDDCSTDNTCEIIQEYAACDQRIKLFVMEENKGAGVARNKSIEEAKGRYIALLIIFYSFIQLNTLITVPNFLSGPFRIRSTPELIGNRKP